MRVERDNLLEMVGEGLPEVDRAAERRVVPEVVVVVAAAEAVVQDRVELLEEAEVVVELVAVVRARVVVPRARRVVLRPVVRRRSERRADGDRPGRHARTLLLLRKPSIRMSQRTVCVIRSPSAR